MIDQPKILEFMIKKGGIVTVLFLTFSNSMLNAKNVQAMSYACFEAAADFADAWGYIFGNQDPEYLHSVFLFAYDACVLNEN